MILALGCGKPQAWSPAVTSISQKTEIRIELPARGMPGFVLEQRADPDDVSLAVLDTGSPFTIFTKRFAARSRLSPRASAVQLQDAQGKVTENQKVARVPSLTIGGATFRDFDVFVADLPAMATLNERLDAVVSVSLFEDLLLTIDYPRRKLVLETGALPAPNGRDVLPLRRGKGGHLLVPAKLLGEDAWLVLDTGHTAEGFTLSRYRLIAMPWASTPIDAYRVQTFLGLKLLRLGRMNEDVVIGHYTVRRPVIGISFNDDVELVGADVLRNFVVTIDQKNGRVRLARPTTQPIQSAPVRRLGFMVTEDEGDAETAVEPLPGSEAARAGLQRGDRLVSINGVRASGWSAAFFQQLEEAGQTLDLVVDRAGQRVRLMIPLTTLVP